MNFNLYKKLFLFFYTYLLIFSSVKLSQANISKNIAAQNHAWINYYGTYQLLPQWSWYAEIQFRRNDFVNNPQQLLLRTAINYSLKNNALISTGYCFVQTYPYGKFPAIATFNENRIWSQLMLKNELGKMEWINRIRLENRFVNRPILNKGSIDFNSSYSNRIRLMQRINFPLFTINKEVQKIIYFAFYDELFVNFGKNIGLNVFDQNRAYAVAGLQINKALKIETGYLNQYLFHRNGISVENNHTFVFCVFHQLNLTQ